MVKFVENYAMGQWIKGKSDGQMLYHAINGKEIAVASSEGLDFGEMMDYARTVGGPALRKMTFQERGLMLKRLALHLLERKEEFYTISWATGATRTDSWVDIEGGIGNLFANASLRRQFGDESFYIEGETHKLSKNGTFIGTHIMTPKRGVAIHINAFNFPVWGMLEKIAVNLLAGVPAIVKPATLTSYLTEAVVRAIVESGILPAGSLQLIAGSARGILDYVQTEDVVTFTGSASTGQQLKAHPRLISEGVPFNLEADSLNACVLGEDVQPGSAEFDLFIKEVVREMTSKTGQKCTAVRRALVPVNVLEDVQIALGQRLASTSVGDPQVEGVRMGALAGLSQLEEVREKAAQLANSQELVFGDLEKVEPIGAEAGKGAFISPLLFLNNDPFRKTDVHHIEAFGPIATLMPYRNMEEAVELVRMGKGSLVCSIVTGDPDIAREFVVNAASLHGRIVVLDTDCARESTGHGSPLPLLVHGGPGRAGGGEEMGGKRGVLHYMQRTAIQGSPNKLTAISSQYQYGADYKEDDRHPFSKYFEEIKIGDTLITAKHTITQSDINNFANLSGDHFYAHVDATSLEGTLFEGNVAHGYYLLSKAAGLFVQAKKGPVLLNYGLDECRFIKPVYPGSTIGVRFTCKEKTSQEKRDADDVAKGIVRWLVDIYDETGESVALATILTMVKKKNQGE
ncbi:MAG TPA: phenylacetic acid degradation bifunctional protein PaaZ [Sphingobacteriaceae bacterium]|nr:phenylacetic acid degradation bifunctional protein PaaZ [Sphingobacteriaceae bacterium]